jgi:hypothetical protein
VPPEFAAILLVCLATLPPEQCTETSAVEVRSIVVGNELGCTQGWQELIAREPQSATAEPVYLKTVCRRIKARADKVGPANAPQNTGAN